MSSSFPFESGALALGFWFAIALWLAQDFFFNVVWAPASRRRIPGSANLLGIGGGVMVAMVVASVVTGLPVVSDAGIRRILAFCGTGVLVTGLALKYWGAAVMRDLFTSEVTILPGHRLVRAGPYRWIRHPACLGAILCGTGLGLAVGAPVVAGAIAVLQFLTYSNRIRMEEKVLAEEFGEAHRAYRAETWRLIPFVY